MNFSCNTTKPIMLVLLILLGAGASHSASESEFALYGGLDTIEGTGVEFQISHYTIDGGYNILVGGEFELRGIIGQADAGISEGNSTVFIGGFLYPGEPLFSSFLFKDGFES